MGALSVTKGTSSVGFKSLPAPVVVNAAVVSTAFAPKLVKMYSPNAKVAYMLQTALVITGLALAGLYSSFSNTGASAAKSASEPVASSQEPVNWRAPLADYTPPVIEILAEDKIPFVAHLSPFLCPVGAEVVEVSFEHLKDEIYVEKYGVVSDVDPGIQIASQPSGTTSAKAAPVASTSTSASTSRRRSERLRGINPSHRQNDDEENNSHGRGPRRDPPAENPNSRGEVEKAICRNPGPFDEAPPPPPPPPGPPSSCSTQDDGDKKSKIRHEKVDWFMLATFVVVVAYARFRKGPELVLAHNPLPPYRGIPDHSTAREGDIQYCIATPEIRRRALPYGHPMTPPRSMAEIFIPLDEGPSFQPSIFAEGVPLAHSDVQPFRRVIGREVVPCPDGFVEVRFEEFSSSRTAWAEEILTAPSQFKANSSIYNLEWRVFSLANAQTLWDVSQFFLVQGGVMSAISFLVMVFQIIFPISSHNTPQDISDGFCNDQPKVISHPDIDEASETLAGSTSNPPLVADVSGEIVANHDVLEQSFSSFSLELQNPLVFDSFADFGPPVASSTEADVAKMLLISEPSFTVDFVLPLSSPSAVDKGKVVQLEDDHEQITPNDASHTVDDLSLPEIVAPVSRSSSTSFVLNTSLNPKAAPFIPRSLPTPVASSSSLPSPCSPSASTAPANPEKEEKPYRRRRKHKSQIKRERREREAAEAAAAAEAEAQA